MTLINYKLDQELAINILTSNQFLVHFVNLTQVSKAEFLHRNRERYLFEIRMSLLFKFQSICPEVNLFREIFIFAACLEYINPSAVK
jgi:hypothetical protein